MKKSNLNKVSVVLALACLALSLGGCVTIAKNINTVSELSHEREDSSIVFGQIRLFENGKKKKIEKKGLIMSVTPHLMKMEDRTLILCNISENGQFVWSLEPGIYLFHMLTFHEPWVGQCDIIMNIAFNVPEKGRIYYIGILRCDLELKRVLGYPSGTANLTIQDEAYRDFSDFQARFDTSSKEIKKSLMFMNIPPTKH